MVRSLDSGSSQDTFSETPCDKDKRIVRTKIYKCVHCIKRGIQNGKAIVLHIQQPCEAEASEESDT
jgi:hypothetical protein